MPAGLCLVVCENYRREFAAALAAHGDEGVSLVTYQGTCGQPMLDWQALEPVVRAAVAAGDEVRVVGGGCLRRLGEPPPGPLRACQVQPEEHCFNLIAGPTLVAHLLAGGEHLLSPGWLGHWRDYARRWGLDEATAAQLFGETATRLTLLDTGVLPDAGALLQQFAAFTGRPCRILPFGLDHLGLIVGRVVDRWRDGVRRAESLAALARAGKESADYQMVFDLVGTLAEVKGEREAVDGVLELFSLLFAPRTLVLARVEGCDVHAVAARPADAACDREAVRSFCAREDPQSEPAGEAGFRVRIGHRGETLAVGVVEQVRFPAHAERYRRVAETVARVCGLALANARDYQRLQTTVAELTAAQASVRTLAGLVPICASCKKIRDDTGFWHSVEQYVQDHSDATFTHGICPDCTKKLFPNFGQR